MARRTLAQRAETFGLEDERPWSLSALQLLFHAPRVYAPLVGSWERRYPGSAKALERLVSSGFAAYQGPVIMDLRTGLPADKESRRVRRFRTTSSGTQLSRAAAEDLRVLEDRFPRLGGANTLGVARLLDALALEGSHARWGMSAPHAITLSGLPERTGRWWVEHLVAAKLVRELPDKHPDVRQIVPAHYRVTRLLCRQLSDVLGALPASSPHRSLRAEFRLSRSRFLSDIEELRFGVTGSTDFDHDVEAQRVLAMMVASPEYAVRAPLAIEPRLHLPVRMDTSPWRFETGAADFVPYQPDALFGDFEDVGGKRVRRRNVFEYERFQSRRDAWSHIERCLGYLHTMCLPSEPAALRFVVDSAAREATYVALIEAFCDYALDHPERMPANPVQLAVCSVGRLEAAGDPLDLRRWHRILLPGPDEGDEHLVGTDVVLHPKEDSPYDEFFARSEA